MEEFLAEFAEIRVTFEFSVRFLIHEPSIFKRGEKHTYFLVWKETQ